MVHTTNSTVNVGVDPSTHINAKTLTPNGHIDGSILPKKISKIDENSNTTDAFNLCTNEVNDECSCNNVDHDDDDKVNKMDDGTVHNCQCNKMLSTYTKPLKNVGKSFR